MHRTDRNILLTRAAVVSALVILSGCTFRPNIISATVTQTSRTDATVLVKVARSDAAAIKSNQFYFTIAAVNCEGATNKFPIQPSIGGQPATDFTFPLSDQYIDITGTIPERILNGYNKACVFLEGGSYLKGKIKSNIVPLVRV